MFKYYFILGFSFFLSLPALSQTLTISSAGNSGTYSYSAGTLTVNANSTITAATIVSWLSSSSLTIVGNTNAITVNVNENIVSSFAGNGLTIGNSNSTGTVTFNNTVNLMGALTVYADKINMGSTVVQDLQSAQLIAGGSSGSISLLARNGFETVATSGNTRGKIMTTGGGNIQINADTQNDNTGQLNIDWLTIDGGTGNIILEASTYVWFANSSISMPELYGSGSLTVRNVPNANYFFSTAWIAIFGNLSGLTLGSNSGIEEISIAPCTYCDPSAKNYTGATWQIAGPINIYGSKVTVDLSLKTTASSADILFKAKNSILVNASRAVTSNNGDITFWANADGTANSTDGDFIGIQNAVVINSANGSTSQSSGGGTITMAGGTTNQTLASGTIVPTDYAYSNRTTNWGPLLPPGGINFGFSTVANGQVNSLAIYSGGGNIVIKGKSNSSSAGIQWFSGSATATQIMNSGNGTILFDGLATSTNAHGIELNSYAASVSPNITSSSSSSSAIRFVGETSTTVDRAGFQGAATLIANATGGGIEISGKNPSNSNYRAVESAGIHTYALTGPITFIGDGGTGLNIGGTWGKGTLPSSSSNIVIRGNVFSLNSPTIQTSGTITVEPFGNSFTNALSFPITNLTLPNTISGLTLGKSTNTTDITIAGSTSISGPVNLYGGNINLDQNINTTGGNALGDILCKASGNIILAASRSMTTSGGDIILWANSDSQSSTGSVALRNASSIVTGSNSVTGGHVWIGGGSNGGTWNGLAVGAGYAVPGTGFIPPTGGSVWTAGVFFESCSITTFGGDAKILGDAASIGRGLISFGTVSIQTNAGDIEIEGNATNSTLGDVNGILFGLHDNSTIGNVSLSSSASGTAITVSGFGRGAENAIGLSGSLTALSTGTGNVVFNGTSYGSGTAIKVGNFYHGILNAFAASGSVTFNCGTKGLEVAAAINTTGLTTGPSKLNIGQGGSISSSTSAVVLTGDAITIGANGIAVNTSGPLTIQPFSNSFTNGLTFPITNLSLANTITGLTLGKSTNTADITISGTTTISGPVTLYGGNINLDQNINTTGGAALGDILCKASGNIVLAASKSITSAAGDVILWANSDGETANGAVYFKNASSIATGGGHIWIGGGSGSTTWNGLSVGNAYAVSGRTTSDMNFAGGIGAGDWSSGVIFNQTTLSSANGHIYIAGQRNSATLVLGAGILNYSGTGTLINAGSGIVTLKGSNTATGSGAWGIMTGLHPGAYSGKFIVQSSNSSASSAITLEGLSSAGTGDGILIENHTRLLSTNGSNGGGISISGTSFNNRNAVSVGIGTNSGTLEVLSASGLIDINVGSYPFLIASSGVCRLGSVAADADVPSSSASVQITSNALNWTGNIPIRTTGALTVTPTAGNSFTSAFNTNVLNFTSITGLTIGNATNTQNITVGAATSINGPITLFGGVLTLTDALSTTNTTTGNMSLNGTTLTGGSLAVADGRTLTMKLSSNTNYTGAISGAGLHFVKDGSGILKLPTPSALSFAAMTISGGGFTLNPNQQLTLTGLLTNNGTFTMKDGATFLQKTSGTSIEGTGTFKVEKLLTGNSNSTWSNTSGRFWYMGVPMVSVERSSYGTYGLTTNRLWSYAESTKSYTELTSGSAPLSAGTGYVHRRSTNDTLIFSAIGADGLYRSDFSASGLTKTAGHSAGYHLVSNPYMAFLDWHAVTKTNVDATYYIRTNNTNNISAIISYNQSTGEATNNSSVSVSAAQLRYIAPMQSIWVRVLGNAGSTGTLAMSRSMLSPQSGNVGLKSSTIFPTKARVNLVDGNDFDQLLVYLNSDMSNEVDEYDSEKMPVAGTVQVYTMSSNKKLVMNGLKNNKKKVSVPLYLELPQTKSYTLQLSEYQVEDGLILLEDKQEGTIQDFTLIENYTFYANSGLLQNRFVLHFILPNAELATQGPSNNWVAAEEGSYTEGGDVEISNDAKGNIEITLNQAVEKKVEGAVFVTDMNGKEVYSGQLEGIITAIELNVPSGIYYLTVQNGTLIEKKKVFIQE